METEQFNNAQQSNSVPSWKLEKQQKKEEKLKAKIIKFGFELQFQELTSSGFTDSRKVFRALKKSKGDIAAATTYLNTTPQEKGGDKTWKKYLKQNNSGSDEEHTHQRKSPQEKLDAKEARKLERRLNKMSAGSDEDRKYRKHKQLRTPEEELNHKEQKNSKALARISEKMPEFAEFNSKMFALGFTDTKKNFTALKKKEGNQEQAMIHLKLKQNLENLRTCDSASKQQFKTLYLDCNNCFFLEKSFLNKAKHGQFREIEEKITILMKLFQNKYGSPIHIVLVFDNSRLVSDANFAQQYQATNFLIITARPQFKSADDLLVSLAQKSSSKDNSIFITSDRMLQARLVEEKVEHIMPSKVFFEQLKKNYIGERDFSAIVDV